MVKKCNCKNPHPWGGGLFHQAQVLSLRNQQVGGALDPSGGRQSVMPGKEESLLSQQKGQPSVPSALGLSSSLTPEQEAVLFEDRPDGGL